MVCLCGHSRPEHEAGEGKCRCGCPLFRLTRTAVMVAAIGTFGHLPVPSGWVYYDAAGKAV